MKKIIEKKVYERPNINIMLFSPMNTFSSMSASGDIMDFEEGGEFDAEYTDPLS